jgi:GT2 family glycosyltransferase
LGVGTPVGGSEDVDYALRARRVAHKRAYRDAALVGHRDKSRSIRAHYYTGGLLVLARHARHGAGGECLRKIAVGAYLTMRRELGVRDFAKALRSAFFESFPR